MRYSKLTNIAPEIGPSKRGGILATMCIHQSRQNRAHSEKRYFQRLLTDVTESGSAVRHLLAFRKSSFDHPHDGRNILERS